MSEIVSHISDTARWVAVYRAVETRRPDALFRDPFAEQLAGARGREIASHMGSPRRFGWPTILRTRLIDELVLTSVAQGCDRVLNLAAGLDTRPYRLALPRELVWIEADLPGMIDDKERLLADARPICQLSREKVDLADARARDVFLTRALAGAHKALILTEGLLLYLPAATVSELGRDFHARSNVAWWMMDLSSPSVLKLLRKRLRHKLPSDAQMQFAPPEGTSFFKPLGWRAEDVKSIFRAAAAHRRLPRFLQLVSRFVKDAPADHPGNGFFLAIVRFARS
jgi:methyltransferase (TIGR00027 family)